MKVSTRLQLAQQTQAEVIGTETSWTEAGSNFGSTRQENPEGKNSTAGDEPLALYPQGHPILA